MIEWTSLQESRPTQSQVVLLVNAKRFYDEMDSDRQGCCVAIGHILIWNGKYYWSVAGADGLLRFDAFTHWMLMQEPPK